MGVRVPLLTLVGSPHLKESPRCHWLARAATPVEGRGGRLGDPMYLHAQLQARRTDNDNRKRRPLLLGVVVLLISGLVATLPLSSSVAATPNPAVSPTNDPANGFPQWYQDGTGTRVAPCLDPNDANCIV